MDRVEYELMLRRLYAARREGDLAELSGMFAAGAVFEIYGAADSKPIAIRTSGSHEFHPWLALLLKTFRITDLVLVTMIIEGSRAAVRWQAQIHSRITGAKVATDLIDLIELENGQIMSYIEFFRRAGPGAS
jgi:ketosteroid isomerase-like protein